MTTLELVVPDRFCGPPSSGNGGWTCGAVAELVRPDVDHAHAWPTVEVTLSAPPPLDTRLTGHADDGTVTVHDDGTLVATGAVVGAHPSAVPPVPVDVARAAEASYPGLAAHPFPTCFACGPERAEGDGLRIFPGLVDRPGPTRVAATWTPHPSVTEDWHVVREGTRHASLPVTWAAVDCVGGWTSDLVGRPMVLGRMTARVDRLPVIGEQHVVVGEARGSEGRKTFTAASLYDAAGSLVATAEHVWIAVS